MTSAPPELSIIIPSYNEELRLPATLSSIASYIRSAKRDVEVIVVDDGSRDQTVAAADWVPIEPCQVRRRDTTARSE